MISLATAAGVLLGALLVLLIFAALGGLDQSQAPRVSSTSCFRASAVDRLKTRNRRTMRSNQATVEAEIDEIHTATRRALNEAAGKSWRNLAE